MIKSRVDIGDCQANFWKLISFLQSVREVDIPNDEFRIASREEAELVAALQGHDKDEVLAAVRTYLGGAVTEQDLQMLLDRRETLDTFERLLSDSDFFAAEKVRLNKHTDEGVWQQFFETNAWIFGYGLTLVSCEAISEKGLESITTGANVFSGGGKRIDAATRTRGFIQSLVFAEIKRHDTDLLMTEQYRQPDVYQASRELSGAVAQVQKTAHKAIKNLQDLHKQHTPDGAFEFEISTIRPRQVVVVGSLEQLADGDNVNIEKQTSFELFRRNQQGVEILTFDELLARTQFIVESREGDPLTPYAG